MKTTMMGIVSAAFAIGANVCNPSHAQSVSEFFSDRQVAIVVGHEAGTGFDVYSRVIVRHMGRHIPGNPNMIVQNMPGASGIKAANWLYSVAPSDGTVMATFSQNVPLEPLFGNPSAKFDSLKFNWIGHMDKSVAICGISRGSGIDKFDDLLKREVLFGATGATGPLVKSANAVANLFGAKIKPIIGYKGSASVKNAIQRGEVHGICGLPWSTVTSFWLDELKSGNFRPILQLSGDRSEELKDVPHARELSKTEEQRSLYNIIFGIYEIGRFYLMPPGVPGDRVSAMRRAFIDMTKDERFLADARRARIDVNPQSGEVLAATLAEILSTPPDVVQRAKEVTLNQPK